MTAPTPSNWLGSQPEPPSSEPPAAPSLTPASAPPAPFSLWALFGLIAGLTVPALAAGLSVLSVFVARNQLEAVPLMISTALAVGAAGLPLAWWSWRRLGGRWAPAWQTGWGWAVVGAVGSVLLLVIGQLFVSLDWAPQLIAALIQPAILAAAAIALLALAAGGWAGMSRLQAWSFFASGAWLSIGLAFLMEVFLIGGLAVAGFIVLMVIFPDDAGLILNLLQCLESASLDSVYDLALRPWAIVGAFVVAALLIPVLEELLKPVGVLLVLGRRPAPMMAFVGGLLGGLGFAFTESLGNLVNIGDPWIALMTARLGTMVMHGFASGLAGWGLGELAAGRPLRWLAALVGAIAVHGLWNGLVVVIVFSGLYLSSRPGPTLLTIFFGGLSLISAFILIMLVPICVAGLIVMGYRLRSTSGSNAGGA